MELVIYAILFCLITIGSFWVVGFTYGLFRDPKIYFPLSLAAKMFISGVVGSVFFMVGSVILPTMVFNAEMAKRSDYRRWPTIIAGGVISIVCVAVAFFSVQWLLWDALGRGV